jgi:hypothetical protein
VGYTGDIIRETHMTVAGQKVVYKKTELGEVLKGPRIPGATLVRLDGQMEAYYLPNKDLEFDGDLSEWESRRF